MEIPDLVKKETWLARNWVYALWLIAAAEIVEDILLVFK